MKLKRFTIDLAEAPTSLQEQIDQNEQAEETLLSKVNERFPEQGFDAPGAASFEEKFYELREQRGKLIARKERIEEFITDEDQAGAWSHHEFEFREPSTEDALYIQGRSNKLAEAAEQRGEQVDQSMFGVTQLLERVRENAPPEAPDNLAGAFPQHVGEWLLDELNEVSTADGVSDLGNSSPQEALESFKSSERNSSREDTTSGSSRSGKRSSTESTSST